MVAFARSHARRLAEWNEVAQQLHDASYYGRWRNDRLRVGDRLPETVVAVELYDDRFQPGLPESVMEYWISVRPKG